MEIWKPTVLLIGESEQGSSYLARRLQARGCECAFATSWEEACSVLQVRAFDLLLSPLRLHERSAFPLVNLLEGSTATLFYYQPVEDDCWWLPALQHGQKCFGSSALRPSEFVAALDETIAEICFHPFTERNGQQSVTPRLHGAIALLPSSRRESPPADF